MRSFLTESVVEGCGGYFSYAFSGCCVAKGCKDSFCQLAYCNQNSFHLEAALVSLKDADVHLRRVPFLATVSIDPHLQQAFNATGHVGHFNRLTCEADYFGMLNSHFSPSARINAAPTRKNITCFQQVKNSEERYSERSSDGRQMRISSGSY